jgi:hypothetical protein
MNLGRQAIRALFFGPKDYGKEKRLNTEFTEITEDTEKNEEKPPG